MSPEPGELPEEEIPKEVIDELREHFRKNVILALNEDIDTDTRSMKANFLIRDDEMQRGVVMDSETFAPMVAEGHYSKSFMVRVNETPNSISVKRVIEFFVFDPKTKPVLLEPAQNSPAK